MKTKTKGYNSPFEMKAAVCEMMHNYISSFGFEDGVKRFAEACRNHANVAESVTKEDFNKVTDSNI